MGNGKLVGDASLGQSKISRAVFFDIVEKSLSA
jgi:hypothetical protein